MRVLDLLGPRRVVSGKGEFGLVEWKPGEPILLSG